MTPKEKAKELVDKYIKLYPSYVVMWQGDVDNAEKNIKQCALIAVDEILNNFGLRVDGKPNYTDSATIQFYQEVKQEIELL